MQPNYYEMIDINTFWGGQKSVHLFWLHVCDDSTDLFTDINKGEKNLTHGIKVCSCLWSTFSPLPRVQEDTHIEHSTSNIVDGQYVLLNK